jgi:hypothetical protein
MFKPCLKTRRERYSAIGVHVLKVLMFHYDILFEFNEQYLLYGIRIICKETQGNGGHFIYGHVPMKLIRLRERLITAVMIKDALKSVVRFASRE